MLAEMFAEAFVFCFRLQFLNWVSRLIYVSGPELMLC
jgi:hypothetical protein